MVSLEGGGLAALDQKSQYREEKEGKNRAVVLPLISFFVIRVTGQGVQLFTALTLNFLILLYLSYDAYELKINSRCYQ